MVNLDGDSGKKLDNMLNFTAKHRDFFTTFGSLEVSRVYEPNFERYVRQTIAQSVGKGISGLKFWKNLGLGIKDKSGAFLLPDDERLQVIWETALEFKLPILIHLGDPVAFFKPIDKYNERYEELHVHPNWWFGSGEYYTFKSIINAQDNLLRRNSKNTFIIAHMGSYVEDLSYVANLLDSYPHLYVDIADRIAELGRMPYTSRAFFEKYSQRILFGTDNDPNRIMYTPYYRFLETKDEYFDYSDKYSYPQGRWKIYGIDLPDDILRKVYYENIQMILDRK